MSYKYLYANAIQAKIQPKIVLFVLISTLIGILLIGYSNSLAASNSKYICPIQNPDFEIDADKNGELDSWEVRKRGNGSFTLKKQGNNTFLSMKTFKKGDGVSLEQEFPIVPQTDYILSFCYRAEGSKTFDISYIFNEKWGNLSPSPAWKKEEMRMNSREYDVMFMQISLGGASGTMELDSIRLYPVAQLSYKGKREWTHFSSIDNLAPNPGFEFSYPDGVGNTVANWDLHSPFWRPDDKITRSGTRSLRISPGRGKHCISSRNYSVIDYTKPYTFFAWVKTEKATGNTYLKLHWCTTACEVDDYSYLRPKIELATAKSQKIRGTRDWKQLKVTSTPPYGAQFVRFSLHSENNTGKVWFDELYFDGFGDDRVEILGSQAGYDPLGRKEVVVRTKEDCKGGKYRLIDAKSKKKVYSSDLKKIGKYTWGRYNWIADFSAFKKEGRYVLEILMDGEEKITSHEFPIKSSLYKDLCQKATEYYFVERCGYDIPGWHKACHLDDGWVIDQKENKIHMDMTGGWHDASDYSKYQMSEGMYALSKCFENLQPEWRERKERFPDVLSEAWWGTQYFLKRYPGNDMVIKGAMLYEQQKSPQGAKLLYSWSPPNRTDNIPGNADDRGTPRIVHVSDKKAAEHLFPLAQFAKAVKPFDQAIFQRCFKVLTDYYDETYLALAADEFSRFRMAEKGRVLLTTLHMHDLDEDNRKKYKLRADLLLRIIMKTMQDEKKLYAEEYKPGHRWWRVYYSGFTFAHVQALAEYIRRFPEDKLSLEAKKSLEYFMEEVVVRLSSRSPYQHLMEYTSRKNPQDIYIGVYPDGRIIGQGGFNRYMCEIAYISCLAAEVLHKPKYLDIAERQIQWVLGRNPRGVCSMGGVGYKQMSVCTMFKSIRELEIESVPGGIVMGIDPGYPVPTHPDTPNETKVHPEGFPVAAVTSTYCALRVVSELYITHTSAVLLACQELYHARYNLKIEGGE